MKIKRHQIHSFMIFLCQILVANYMQLSINYNKHIYFLLWPCKTSCMIYMLTLFSCLFTAMIVFCLFTAMVRRFTTMEPVCCSGGVYDWMSPSMLGTWLGSAGRGQGSPQSRDRPLGAGFTSHTMGVAWMHTWTMCLGACSLLFTSRRRYVLQNRIVFVYTYWYFICNIWIDH